MTKEPNSLFDKIWNQHEIKKNTAGQSLLFIDRHFCHELSFHAFNMLEARKMRVRHPKRTIAIADHYTPTSGTNKSNFTNIAHYNLYKNLESNAS